jgi:hypothetical protein
MSAVSVKVSDTLLKSMMDAEFNRTSDVYTLYIYDTITSVANKVCTFKAAVIDGTKAKIAFNVPVYFPVASGVTINTIKLSSAFDTENFILSELVTSKTYSAAGTYTVSDLIIKVGI